MNLTDVPNPFASISPHVGVASKENILQLVVETWRVNQGIKPFRAFYNRLCWLKKSPDDLEFSKRMFEFILWMDGKFLYEKDGVSISQDLRNTTLLKDPSSFIYHLGFPELRVTLSANMSINISDPSLGWKGPVCPWAKCFQVAIKMKKVNVYVQHIGEPWKVMWINVNTHEVSLQSIRNAYTVMGIHELVKEAGYGHGNEEEHCGPVDAGSPLEEVQGCLHGA